ncbi:hypothetical protein B0H14DRAFT_2833250 [Mycena olivaceomarginata]|nr:hypothetical protein B0H14DRAFT_2833250 [Mycena olivaceomarginata]
MSANIMFPLQLVSALISVGMALGPLAITPPVANTIVPVNFAGNAAAIQAPAFGEDTRVYYQADVSGGILELAFTGPATVGKAFSIQTLIPAAQVQPRTLIAAVITDGVDFTGTHVYFVSPDNILSEYINPGGAWIGGPTCTTCIDRNRFAVQPGNSVLYALANNGPNEPAFIRVGFVSAGAPGALSEAVFTTAHGWTLAQVSN